MKTVASKELDGRWTNVILFAAAAALLFVFLLVLWLCTYARPQTDDLYRAYVTRAGLGPALHQYWMQWGARWFAWIIHVVPETVGMQRGFVPLLIICISATSASGALATHFLFKVRWLASLVVGCALVTFVFLRASETGDLFFWGAGVVENVLPVAAILTGFVLLTRPRRIARISGLIVLLLGGGLHELVAMYVAGAVSFGALVAWSWRHPSRWLWLAGAVLLLAHFTIISLAPGNFERAAYMKREEVRTPAAGLIATQLIDMARRWITEPMLLSASLLVAAAPMVRPHWAQRPPIELGALRVRWEWLLLVAGCVLVVATVAIHAFSTGVLMPGRTRGLVQAIFLVCWFSSIVCWCAERFAHRSLLSAAAAALAVSVMLAPRTESALRDARTNAPAWAAAMDQRHVVLQAAAALDGNAVLDPLPSTPATFWDQGVINDRSHYRNYHTRHYYRLQNVVVRDANARTVQSTR